MSDQVEGYVRCPFTGEVSEVLRNKKRRLYYRNAGVGPLNAHGHALQAWIERNMVSDPTALDRDANAQTPTQTPRTAASAAAQDDL
jgi:hypothetical protein